MRERVSKAAGRTPGWMWIMESPARRGRRRKGTVTTASRLVATVRKSARALLPWATWRGE